MLVLFPSDPLSPRGVESDFADQEAAARAAGFRTALVSYESLVHGRSPLSAAQAVRGVPEDAGLCLYRGWMLEPHKYGALARVLTYNERRLVVSPEAYVYGHHLPGWYDDFRDVTARSVWTTSGDPEAAQEALRQLPDGPAIVKDYVKSAKHLWQFACFIPDVRDEDAAMRVIRFFLAEQGAHLNGGVVLRAYRPYPSHGVDERTGMPLIEERRLFLWHGRALPVVGDEEALLASAPAIEAAIGRLRSPFVSLDLARLEDGSWEVVEVGDGQVSGLRDMDPHRFYRVLHKVQAGAS